MTVRISEVISFTVDGVNICRPPAAYQNGTLLHGNAFSAAADISAF
jgi:hypothetical protein